MAATLIGRPKNGGKTQSDWKPEKTEEIPAKKGPETGIPRNSARNSQPSPQPHSYYVVVSLQRMWVGTMENLIVWYSYSTTYYLGVLCR